MAKSQPRILTEEYWRSFALTAEELDYLHELILDAGIPQTVTFLAYDLVERRCEQGEARVDEPAAELWGIPAKTASNWPPCMKRHNHCLSRESIPGRVSRKNEFPGLRLVPLAETALKEVNSARVQRVERFS